MLQYHVGTSYVPGVPGTRYHTRITALMSQFPLLMLGVSCTKGIVPGSRYDTIVPCVMSHPSDVCCCLMFDTTAFLTPHV